MTSPLSRRALAAGIATLEREKRQRIEKLSKEEQEKLEVDLEAKNRELQELQERQRTTKEKEILERKELEDLQRSLLDALRDAADEQEILHLQRRILDFSGNDNSAVKERMVKEGWGEQLVSEVLQTRTLEQSLERTGGQQASFVRRDNPLEHILAGQAKLYDITDKRVLSHVQELKEQALNKGYLAPEQLDEVRKIEYMTNRFAENELYKGMDDRNYIGRTNEVVDSIKRQLGLEWESPGLTYAGKRL